MSKGTAKVKFIGGFLDGRGFDQFDSRSLRDSVSQFNGMWCEELSGKVSILKGEKLGTNWINFSVDKYDKQPKSEDGSFTYIYSGTSVVLRCKAVTKIGLRCQHVTKEGFDFCQTHFRHK